MAYFEESVRQMEDKSYLEKWNSAAEAIADSDRNACGDFDCNICLEYVQDPVVTLCGHLFCWPCLYKWLRFHSIEEQQRPFCPVCKSQVSQSSLIPIYGRGQTPRPSKPTSYHVGFVIPPRPSSTATLSQSSSRHYSHRSQLYNSIPGGHSSTNAFNTTIGEFGAMIYARVFGNQLTNMYTYPNSYQVAGNSSSRIRRQLQQADKSLGRICFFLLCCTMLCLLLF